MRASSCGGPILWVLRTASIWVGLVTSHARADVDIHVSAPWIVAPVLIVVPADTSCPVLVGLSDRGVSRGLDWGVEMYTMGTGLGSDGRSNACR